MAYNHIPTVLGALVISAAVLTGPVAAAEAIETKLQICSSCHGQNGQPIAANIPIIWGQTEYFIVKQMHDFKTHDRESAIMSPMAQPFTVAELRPLAQYFAGKTWPTRPATAVQASAPASTTPPNGTAVCQICHQEKFVGGLPAPRLAGQSYEYLVAAMNSFADGERTNNADMVSIMKGLSAEQRDTIARYISGL
jgi:cytochrome c553